MNKLRCDQKADCDDQSDEASCQIVHLNPEQYLKDKPPPPLEVGSLVKILVNVDIERILTISEVSIGNFNCCNHRHFSRWTAFLRHNKASGWSGGPPG